MISNFKKAFSYLLSLQLEKSTGENGDELILQLNKGRLQLATETTIYSWEDLYYPFEIAFNKNFEKVKNAKSCLVIGMGMGSIVSILNKKMNLQNIHFVGIEKEKIIGDWLKKYKSEIGNSEIYLINNDAEKLDEMINARFDIICVDVFKNRSVPAFVQSNKYLQQCFSLLNENGILFFNTIPFDAEKLANENFEENFKSIFKNNSTIKMKENEMWISEKKKNIQHF